jgi:hypothetical protein
MSEERQTRMQRLLAFLQATAREPEAMSGRQYVRATRGEHRPNAAGPKTYGPNGPGPCARRRRQMERLAAQRAAAEGVPDGTE